MMITAHIFLSFVNCAQQRLKHYMNRLHIPDSVYCSHVAVALLFHPTAPKHWKSPSSSQQNNPDDISTAIFPDLTKLLKHHIRHYTIDTTLYYDKTEIKAILIFKIVGVSL